MNALEAFKIHYLDKKEIVIRTDCQAIISFYNKSSNNKPSRVRWIAFTDYITGIGVSVQFEHIKGEQNKLADSLSRLVCSLIWKGAPATAVGLCQGGSSTQSLEGNRSHKVRDGCRKKGEDRLSETTQPQFNRSIGGSSHKEKISNAPMLVSSNNSTMTSGQLAMIEGSQYHLKGTTKLWPSNTKGQPSGGLKMLRKMLDVLPYHGSVRTC